MQQQQFRKTPFGSVYSDELLSSPTSISSESASETESKFSCAELVNRVLSGLKEYLGEVHPEELCGALAVAIRKEYGWTVRWTKTSNVGSHKAPWNNPLSHECQFTPPQWSGCVLVIIPEDRVECVVDTCFRSKFDVGKCVPVYDQLLERVPDVFIGTPQELQGKVEKLANGVTSCFQFLGWELPPWRTRESLQKLYKGCLENDGARGETALRAMIEAVEAEEEAGAAGGVLRAEVRSGLCGYLRAVGALDRWPARAEWSPDAEDPSPPAPVAEGGPSLLTRLLSSHDLAPQSPMAPVAPPPPLEAWSTLVEGKGGSLRRVKRLLDLEACCPALVC